MLTKITKLTVFTFTVLISLFAAVQFAFAFESQQAPTKSIPDIASETGVGRIKTQALGKQFLGGGGTSLEFFSMQFDKTPFHPQSILFDGSNLWVGGQYRDVILKVDPATGHIIQVVGIAKYGVGVPDLAFDGAYVWALVNQSVVKVRASDGAIIGTYSLNFDKYGFTPQSILYSHKYIWIGGKNRDILLKVDPASGQIIQRIELAKYGDGVPDLVSDRKYIYAPVHDFLIQVRVSDGAITDTFYYNFDSTPFYAKSLAYDYGSGERVWAGGRERDLAVGIKPATGTTQVIGLGKYGVGVPALLYHKQDLWAIVRNQLIQIDLASATVIYPVTYIPDPGTGPIALASDGASIWIAHGDQGALIKY